MKRRIVALAVVAAVAAGIGVAQAQTQPNISDIATCNQEAEAAAPSPSASPGLGANQTPGASGLPNSAHGGIPAATGGNVGGPTDSTGQAITNPVDPRLEGMAAARAGDPHYRDAYRACMERLGH